MRKNERTLQMMENYVTLHSAGNTPREIAEKYNLSITTVYEHLQEIADKAGVSRESLLKTPHDAHVAYERVSEPVVPIDTKKIDARFKRASEALSELHLMMADAINDMESFDETLGREEI